MGTPHNDAKIGEIAKTVIMPGDPKRATRIAKTFLSDTKLVSDVRGISTYTGKYNNTDVTIMASGMGIPSMGVYAYELFKFYNVENIIRVGSCGANVPNLNLFDIILSEKSYNEGNFALTFASEDCHIVESCNFLNNKIINTAKSNNINLHIGNTICCEAFDAYMLNYDKYCARIPKDLNPIATEMEAFSLFYIAKKLNKNAACLMTVVDSIVKKFAATTEDRETGLNKMIKLALDSI